MKRGLLSLASVVGLLVGLAGTAHAAEYTTVQLGKGQTWYVYCDSTSSAYLATLSNTRTFHKVGCYQALDGLISRGTNWVRLYNTDEAWIYCSGTISYVANSNQLRTVNCR